MCIRDRKITHPALASFKMVDTCAAEFAAETPYFYSTYDEANEAVQFLDEDVYKRQVWVICAIWAIPKNA